MKHKINKVNANALKGDIVMDKKDIKKVFLGNISPGRGRFPL